MLTEANLMIYGDMILKIMNGFKWTRARTQILITRSKDLAHVLEPQSIIMEVFFIYSGDMINLTKS